MDKEKKDSAAHDMAETPLSKKEVKALEGMINDALVSGVDTSTPEREHSETLMIFSKAMLSKYYKEFKIANTSSYKDFLFIAEDVVDILHSMSAEDQKIFEPVVEKILYMHSLVSRYYNTIASRRKPASDLRILHEKEKNKEKV